MLKHSIDITFYIKTKLTRHNWLETVHMQIESNWHAISTIRGSGWQTSLAPYVFWILQNLTWTIQSTFVMTDSISEDPSRACKLHDFSRGASFQPVRWRHVIQCRLPEEEQCQSRVYTAVCTPTSPQEQFEKGSPYLDLWIFDYAYKNLTLSATFVSCLAMFFDVCISGIERYILPNFEIRACSTSGQRTNWMQRPVRYHIVFIPQDYRSKHLPRKFPNFTPFSTWCRTSGSCESLR